MKYPEGSKFMITKIVFGDIDSLGKGNSEFFPQSGLEIHYKIWCYQTNPETKRYEKTVVGSGCFGYPMFNRYVEFSEIEHIINKDLVDKFKDIIISCEEILGSNGILKDNVTSILSGSGSDEINEKP